MGTGRRLSGGEIMTDRRLLSVDSQAQVFAIAWLLRDLRESTYVDADQLRWIQQELLGTFHLTDEGLVQGRLVYADLKAAAAAAAAERAEAKRRREDERRVRIEARRARAAEAVSA